VTSSTAARCQLTTSSHPSRLLTTDVPRLLTSLDSLVLTVYTEARRLKSSGAMSKTFSAAGGATWRSVDTNVLLQNIDELDTTRTYASVDTDMLLADIDTVPSEQLKDRVDTEPYVPPVSRSSLSPSSKRRSASLQVPPLRGNASRDSFDMMTARSVSSVGCESVVYDTDRRHLDDVTASDAGLAASRNDFAYSADFEAEDTARSDTSLDAAIRLRDSSLEDANASASPPRSARTSRTLASVDTNILLKTTEDVVLAMENARGRHEHARLDYDVIETHQSASMADERLRNVGEVYSHFDDEQTELDLMDDISMPAIASVTTDVERREQIESLDGRDGFLMSGRHQRVANSSPPVQGVKSVGTTATHAWMPGSENGSSNLWHSLSDLDLNGTDHSSQYRQALAKSKSSLSRLTEKRFNDSDVESTTDCSSDVTSAGRPSAFHVNGSSRHRMAAAGVRSRSSSRTMASEQLADSSRSMTSGASLGQKIVARSRDNMKPTIKYSSPADGGRHLSMTGKQVSFQRQAKSTAGGVSKSTAPSPTGLLLEGYRVPVRPASTTFSRPQHFSDSQGMKTWNSVDKTIGRVDQQHGKTQHVNDTGVAVNRSPWQRGEHQRTTHNGWVSGTAPPGNHPESRTGFETSLYTTGDEDGTADVETARDEQVCHKSN